MKEAGSPKLFFENLDLTPIHLTLLTDLHTEGPGRPVEYNPEWDLKALMRARTKSLAPRKCTISVIPPRWGAIQEPRNERERYDSWL